MIKATQLPGDLDGTPKSEPDRDAASSKAPAEAVPQNLEEEAGGRRAPAERLLWPG